MKQLFEKAKRLPVCYWLYYVPLLAAAIGLALFLKDADLPWEAGVAAREAAGKSVKAMHHGISGLWYGAWAALAVIFILAVAGPFALRQLSGGFQRSNAGLGKRSTPAFFIFGTIAVAIAAYEMAPTLKHSLWGDEDYAARRSIVGQWERNAEGELWFRDVTWWDSLFAYKTPNNHFLYTIFARLSHDGYHPGDDPTKLHFDETRIRLPSFIAGLGAVLSLGYLVSVIGYRRAGIAAMFLLAFHPWFLRHGAEARGYPLALFLAPLAITFLIKALRRGRGVYWALFALFETLTFYAYPGTLYILICINLAALGHIAIGRKGPCTRDRLSLTYRWFAANTAAALPLVFLLMPVFKQLRGYMDRSARPELLNGDWLVENISHMATGMPWSHNEPDNPWRPALDSSPSLSTIVLVLFYALAALGIFRLCRGKHLWLAIAIASVYPLTLFHAKLNETIIFQWYTLPSLPLFIAAVALGLEFLTSGLRPVRKRTFAGFGVLAITLFGYASFTYKPTSLQRAHSVEQLRESVKSTRNILNPFHPDIDKEYTVQFCMAARGYDPATYFIRPERKEPDGAERVKKLLLQADADGAPLHVNIAMVGLARRDWPKLMKVVENEELFELLPPLYGLQYPCTRYIYRYRPNSYKAEDAQPAL